ncbi:DNA polymerase I [Tsukamurella phage TPA2]|uniref:DNA polymerase I n=1 Tax=Tsukamurella phage TPA2 TaxID=981330 RepID=UPI0001FF8DD6|nr:DNA polymerase I [Tsukamurella phage TPA2]ADX31977.1 DNA polymerase I [Tsukamurella phage TPA2]
MPRVPSRTWYDPTLDAVLHTGEDALHAVADMPSGVDVATDIETPGLLRQFDINCVTAAWRHGDGRVHSVLLDPDRTPHHDEAVREIYDSAEVIILQNGVFDLPALLHSGLITPEQIREKFLDTLLPARMIDTSSPMARSLTMLVKRHLGVEELTGGIELAFKAAGYKRQQDGYEGMDIDSPIYRLGAMADTVMTLALWPVLYEAAIDQQLDHPFQSRGCVDRAEAQYVVERMITELRIVGTRVAKGVNVDRGALERYADSVEDDRRRATATLAAVGLEGGKGKESKIIEYLASVGHLPADWPRTPSGKLKATKDLMEGLGDPIATAQRTLAHMDQLTGYLEKVEAQSQVTGRCHPQISVAGAAATGRMSISSPPLQQFSGPARAILTADEGQRMWSVDWSQIEPVTMALLAGDSEFLAPFAAGADLYEPIMRAAGIERKVAKVLLLQTMYGSGAAKIAETIGHTPESAVQLRRQMFAAMPESSKFMSRVQTLGDTHGKIVTAGKRVLDVDSGFGYKATNYICQGTALDILTETIIELDRRGLGDSMLWWMHDEILVSGPPEVAREVQEVMEIVPDFMRTWPGHIDKLRTECEVRIGAAWAEKGPVVHDWDDVPSDDPADYEEASA